ncbi:PH domain-containing protein [Lysobacter sp. CW239]|uniref:PH domain-containing protein n=1 Tax=Lysobacteraceae TaxID=32033 RepID=UPI00068FA168|nr:MULTISPECIES: PH domain-containing protein [Lysobacter]QOD91249.1 PH domain-containing protein [Lysobacter sp. CW239]
MTPPSAADPGPALPLAGEPADWQPLPIRARALFLLGTMPSLALPGAVIGYLAGQVGGGLGFQSLVGFASLVPALIGSACGLLIGGGFGFWLGLKRYRYTFWRLDSEGLAVRRGRMWWRETRVPATRVQHLDLKRGPLQRRRQLATLVVHTAGTRHSAVEVVHLDLADAEHLRDRLARQIDHDDDD